jgi:stearoyl-CoA desaturase (delta-9 desaturase)
MKQQLAEGAVALEMRPDPGEAISWVSSVPFGLMHLVPFLAFFTGTHWADWAVCVALYVVRMLGLTIGYHRYFSHRAFKVGRVTQFFLALLGATANQKGVLWWAGHHRHHHEHSDTDEDLHSPTRRGLWWSHVGWILCDKYRETPMHKVKDLARYPELVWLNRYWIVPPVALGTIVFLIGGWSMLFIGYFLSTIVLYHGTYTINSLSHLFGSRRFGTTDTSRNNLFLALLTLGEGWHNNHHHYMSSANQGFYWWEIDLSYYVIKAMEFVGLASDVRKPSERILNDKRVDRYNGFESELPPPEPKIG